MASIIKHTSVDVRQITDTVGLSDILGHSQKKVDDVYRKCNMKLIHSYIKCV